MPFRPFRTSSRNTPMAIAPRKGGAGQTSSTISLADSLARKGKRALLIDIDFQANSSKALLPNYPQLQKHQTFLRPSLSAILFLDSQPMCPILRSFRRMEQAGVRRVRLCDARHACPSWMANNGVPDTVVSAWAGHRTCRSPSGSTFTLIHRASRLAPTSLGSCSHREPAR